VNLAKACIESLRIAGWLCTLVATGAIAASHSSIDKPTKAPAPHFSVVEADIAGMQNAMAQGRITSRELVLQYLTRIAYYEDTLNAAITINRHALQEAEALDRERARGKVRGPLHGIPIALKDNIHMTDMPTTGACWHSMASCRHTRRR